MAISIFNETLEIDSELDQELNYSDTRDHDESEEMNDVFWVESPECR
jgi:hypothetical protein